MVATRNDDKDKAPAGRQLITRLRWTSGCCAASTACVPTYIAWSASSASSTPIGGAPAVRAWTSDTMSGYDRGEIYSQVAFPADRASKDKEHQARFVEFVREFRVDNNFIYRYALT